MNKITKGIAVIALSLFSFSSQSQIVAIKGGLNLSSMNITSDFGIGDPSMALGFHLGTTFDIPLTEMFAIETGLFATTKGARWETSFFGVEITQNINILNAEIPLSFKAMFPLGDDVKLYTNAGGYIGVGITGINRIKVEGFGQTENEEEEITFDDDGFERLDYGLTFGAGAEFKGFILGASYDLGLANISDDSDATIQNRVIKITLGYRFGWDN